MTHDFDSSIIQVSRRKALGALIPKYRYKVREEYRQKVSQSIGTVTKKANFRSKFTEGAKQRQDQTISSNLQVNQLLLNQSFSAEKGCKLTIDDMRKKRSTSLKEETKPDRVNTAQVCEQLGSEQQVPPSQFYKQRNVLQFIKNSQEYHRIKQLLSRIRLNRVCFRNMAKERGKQQRVAGLLSRLRRLGDRHGSRIKTEY